MAGRHPLSHAAHGHSGCAPRRVDGIGGTYYAFIDPGEEDAEFQYHLQLNPGDVHSSIGTSTLLAAWNAAACVGQIDDSRLTEAMSHGRYLEATDAVLRKHKGLWFTNECFVVAR